MTARLGGLGLALVLGCCSLTACSEDGPSEDPPPPTARATDGEPLKETGGLFHGTYVGRATKAQPLVAVEAASPGDKKERTVTVFVCDGRGVAEFFPAEVSGNEFTLTSGDEDTSVKGVVTANEVTGTIRFGEGRTVAFAIPRAAGAAGLYDLAVDANGDLTGGTDHGVGATGRTALAGPGKGHLDLADGRRVAFRVRAAEGLSVDGSGARVIVLGDGKVAGVLPRDDGSIALSSLSG